MLIKVARTLLKTVAVALILFAILIVATGALIKLSPRTILAGISYFSDYQIDAHIIKTEILPLRFSAERLQVFGKQQESVKPLFRSNKFETTLNWVELIHGSHSVWTVNSNNSSISLVQFESKSDEPSQALKAINLHSYLSLAAIDLSLLEVEIDANQILKVDQLTNSINSVDGSELSKVRSASDLRQLLEFKLRFLDKERTLNLTGELSTAEVEGSQQIKLQVEQLDLRHWLANPDTDIEGESNTDSHDLVNTLNGVSNSSLAIDLQELLIPQGTLSNLFASLHFKDSIEISQLTGNIDVAINDQFQLEETLDLAGIIQPKGSSVSTDLNGRIGSTELSLNAVVDPRQLTISQGRISVNLPTVPLSARTENASDLIENLNPWLPITAEISFNRDREYTEQNHSKSWKADINSIRAGGSDVSGEISSDTPGKLVVQLSSELISLITNTESKENESLEELSDKSLLLSNTPFNFDLSTGYAVSGSWYIETLKIDPWKLEQITLPFELTDGQTSISEMSFGVAGGQVSSSIDITYNDKFIEHGELTLSASKLDLEHLNLGEAGNITGGDTELTLQLSTSGSNPNALLNSLNGHVLLTVDNAKINNDAFEVIGSDLLIELLTKINPFIKSDPTTKLECAVINLPIKQGQIKVDKSIAIETAKMIMTASGKINLGDNSLKLKLTPQARGGLGIDVGTLVKFIEVGGRVNAPKPIIGATGLLKSGVAVGAAISTGGASLLVDGLISKMAKGKACELALKIRPEPTSQSSPSGQPKRQEKDKSE